MHKDRKSNIAPVEAAISNRHTRLPVVPPYTEAPEGWKEIAFLASTYGATRELPNWRLGTSEI